MALLTVISGLIPDSAHGMPYTIFISAPEHDQTTGDYSCLVRATGFEFRIQAFGTSPQQAIRAAFEMSFAKLTRELTIACIDDLSQPPGESAIE